MKSTSRVLIGLRNDKFSRGQVLESDTHALKHSYFLTIPPNHLHAYEEFVKISENMGAGDYTFGHGDEQITGFGKCTLVSVDDNSRTQHRNAIYFSGVRPKGADAVKVGTGTQQMAIKERGC